MDIMGLERPGDVLKNGIEWAFYGHEKIGNGW